MRESGARAASSYREWNRAQFGDRDLGLPLGLGGHRSLLPQASAAPATSGKLTQVL
jgi:hypothetical protein